MSSEPLVLGFENFKQLIKNHRLYYYKGDAFYDFNFLADGIIVKTSILKSEIENEKQFFSDTIFYGAMELKFRIPNPKSNLNEVDGIKTVLSEPILIQDEEVKNINIQQEGVE